MAQRLLVRLMTALHGEAVADATAAPPLHNSQPWRFVAHGNAIDLYLDQERVLPVADPLGLEARLACGAALFNLRLALRIAGYDLDVWMLPDRARPTLQATVALAGRRPGTPLELELHGAIPRRHSHRRPFDPSPVPSHIRRLIAEAAMAEGAELRLVDEPRKVSALTALVRRADWIQRNDPRFVGELARWSYQASGRTDGVPSSAHGPRPAAGSAVVMRDFAPEQLPRVLITTLEAAPPNGFWCRCTERVRQRTTRHIPGRACRD